MNDKTHFGFQEVDVSKKAEHVGDVLVEVIGTPIGGNGDFGAVSEMKILM